jgi:type I restriction enzyme S subunit
MMSAPFPNCELGEIAELYDSLHQTPQYAAEGYPMIRVTDIRRGFVSTIDAVRVDEETYRQFSKKHRPQVGDILFSRVGSYGNSVYVNRDDDFCLGQNTVCISPQKSRIEPTFLYCALNSDNLRSQIESLVGGASQGTISLKSIRKLQVPIPPIQLQRRIAGILSAYDDLIENNQRRIKILEEMARSLYREWFVLFRFPGHDKVKMVPSTLGPIPKGWEVTHWRCIHNGAWWNTIPHKG